MLSTVRWRKRTEVQTTQSNIWQGAWKVKIDYLCCVLIEAQICIKIKKILITDPIILKTVTSICSSSHPRSFLVHFPQKCRFVWDLQFFHSKLRRARREDRQNKRRRCFTWWTSIKIDEACRISCLRWFWTSDSSLEKERERDFLKQNLLRCQWRKTIDGVDRDWCGNLS
jgi:hypothetical protein